jgi:hypothetical protein
MHNKYIITYECLHIFFKYKSLSDVSSMIKLLKVRAPTTLKSEGEVTSLSGADKREVRDNREKW